MFLQDLASYRGLASSSSSNRNEANAALQKILRDYFADGAAYEINIDHALRKRVVKEIVEGKMKKEGGEEGRGEGGVIVAGGEGEESSPGALNEAEEEVLRMLINPYNRFVRAVGCLAAARRTSVTKKTIGEDKQQ